MGMGTWSQRPKEKAKVMNAFFYLMFLQPSPIPDPSNQWESPGEGKFTLVGGRMRLGIFKQTGLMKVNGP